MDSWHIAPSFMEDVIFVVLVGVPLEEEDEAPTVCTVLKEGFALEAEEIEKFVAECVSDSEKLRRGLFVTELPKTPTG
jgi:acyl-coenzyme A synthetase/AMP-(fatty) acid ligase